VRFINRVSLLSAILIIWVGRTAAQVNTATLYTIVTDHTEAVIANASINLREERTGIARTQASDAAGESAFTFVPIGTYTLSISSPGFKTLAVSGLTLGAGQNERRNFVLEIGSISDKVTVTAETPLVNTVSAEQLFTHKSTQIEELPIARRRATDLVSIGTAIQRNAPTGTNNNAGAFRMNGLGGAAINVTMDGIPASGDPGSAQAGMRGGFNYIEIVSLEAIEEISVAKGAFSAEFSNALSGNINVITKSGTNKWHGSLFEAFNAENLNARPTFLTFRPPLTFNQFGGSIGGPIKKDRVFIFGVYEGYQDRRFATVNGLVFTPRFRNDLLARNPGFRPILDEVYLPNQPFTPTAATALYTQAASLKANTDHVVIKSDAWLSSHAKVTATWLRDRPDLTFPTAFQAPGPNSFRTFTGRVDRVNVNFTTFRANWSAETRFGRNKVDNDRGDQVRTSMGPLLGITAIGVSVGDGEISFIGDAPHWVMEQKVTVQHGRHSLKFGGILNRAAFGQSLSHGGELQYNTAQDLLNNAPTSARFDFGTKPWVGKAYNVGFFLQDDWKVTPRLVLNLGLRYDYFGHMPVKGRDGGSSPALHFAPFTDFATFSRGGFRPADDPYDSDPINLGPRFGFAYNPDRSGKTVIRGGFGMMFMPFGTNILDLTPLNSTDLPFRVQPSSIELDRLGIRYPITIDQAAGLLRSPGAGLRSGDQADTMMQAPYALNYSFGIQRALGASLMLETAFVGTSGRKFLAVRQYNQPDRLTGIRPNPNLVQGRYWDNSDSTQYASWQTSLRKHYSHGFTGSVHYTWGKAISYQDGDLSYSNNQSTQDFANMRAERARAKEDLQHVFVGNWIYTIPIFSNSAPLLRNTLGNWQASSIFRAQSGFPINISQSSARIASRPDILLDFKGAILNSGLQYLNPAAFALVPINSVSRQPVRPGNIGRMALTAPGRWNVDFSLAKNFRFLENVQVQFRADMLNVFNHIDLVAVATNVVASNFGQLTGGTEPRTIQFHMRFSF